jgi:hypothetical protein
VWAHSLPEVLRHPHFLNPRRLSLRSLFFSFCNDEAEWGQGVTKKSQQQPNHNDEYGGRRRNVLIDGGGVAGGMS